MNRIRVGLAIVLSVATYAAIHYLTRPKVPMRMMCLVPGEGGMEKTMVWDSVDMWVSPFSGKIHSPNGVYSQQFAGELCLIVPRNPNTQQGVQ